MPSPGLHAEGIQRHVDNKAPPGAAEFSRGPTFEGDPIAADELGRLLTSLDFELEAINPIGASNRGVFARLPPH
ncbi:MAG: hypothetical protein AB1486_05820 [Planctomycetota bacterium]